MYRSKAQAGYFHAAKKRGEISPSVVQEFDNASRGRMSHLPEHIKKARGGMVHLKQGYARGGLVIGDNRLAEGTRRSGSIMFHGGGELPEPEGEEMEPPDTVCPRCGYAFGGEIPEPEGEEMEPENEGNFPFSKALRKLRP